MHLRAELLAGLTWLTSACSPPQAAAPIVSVREAVEVETLAVRASTIQRYVRATGTLFGEEQTTLAAKVAGRVEAVLHDVGDALAPGDPLARIEATDYTLAAAERRRAFEQALARLGLRELPGDDFRIEDLPAVERAELQAENARARFERAQILHQRTPPAVSDQDFADMRTAWDVAQADQRLAVLTAQAQLAEARTLQAQLATAEQRVADTLHRTPSGERPPVVELEGFAPRSVEYLVTRRHVAPGDYVQVGAPLFELVDPDPLELRVRIPERELPRIRVGQAARLSVEAFERQFSGVVARVNPAVDVRTRTFEVEILVPNAERVLRAGSFARAAIEVEQDTNVLLVPKAAVTTFAGVRKVFVVADGKAVERVVTLGAEVDARVEVVSGLTAGETLVVELVAGLAGGAPVRIKSP